MSDIITEIYIQKVCNKQLQTEDVNPVTALQQLLDTCISSNYYFNGNGECCTTGSVKLRGKQLTKIPVKFGKVKGNFDCSDNQLTSLENAPSEVGGNFYCSGNLLTTLDFTTKIKGDLYCSGNIGLPYKELFKILDNVQEDIIFNGKILDPDKLRRDRDIHMNLQHDELGNLDI